MRKPDLLTGTPLAQGLKRLFEELVARTSLSVPVAVYLAGGMATYLYTGMRVSSDVDAEFSRRLLIPGDLSVEVDLADGHREVIYFDTNYNSSFALMHEDHLADAIDLDIGVPNIQLKLLSPVDLAVSKIARLSGHDREDIASLVRCGLVTSGEIEARANEALGGFVGGIDMLKHNIRDAVQLARQVEAESNSAFPRVRPSP